MSERASNKVVTVTNYPSYYSYNYIFGLLSNLSLKGPFEKGTVYYLSTKSILK